MCILNPVSAAVCVDRHAYDAALGVKGDDVSRHALDRVGVYQLVADAYRAAAARVGISPAQCQAVVWCAWRSRWAWRTV